MRNAGAAMISHLQQRVTSVTTCWKVTRTDGEVFGFTAHDEDLVIGGVTYAAATGVTPSAVQSQAGLAVDNTEVVGAFDSDAMTDEDLANGVWDHAEVLVFVVNWQNTRIGPLRELRGWLGEVTNDGAGFKAELRSLASALNSTIGEIVEAGCKAALGDARCRVDMAPFTFTGVVTVVDGTRNHFGVSFDGSAVPDDGFCNYGKLTFTSGTNTGASMEIKTQTDSDIVLQLPVAHTIAIGDTFSAQAGCDKTLATCHDKFNNVVNFRGFPTLPGMDAINLFGGQI